MQISMKIKITYNLHVQTFVLPFLNVIFKNNGILHVGGMVGSTPPKFAKELTRFNTMQ